jgi:splicing factor, arginine/serine-rich 4/5/6
MLMLGTLLVQDLKDFGREAGNVSFADIDRDVPGQGYIGVLRMLFSVLIRLVRILEYLNREDAERAVKELDGRDLRGQAVRVDLFEDVSIGCLFLGWGLGFN